MRYIILTLVAFMFIGCATKHYGRQAPLSNFEKENLTCRELDIEVAKSDELIKYISQQSTTIDGKEVLAFLGDFGIGNAIEAQAANESVLKRLDQLRELQVLKGCEVSLYFKNKYNPLQKEKN